MQITFLPQPQRYGLPLQMTEEMASAFIPSRAAEEGQLSDSQYHKQRARGTLSIAKLVS